LGWNFKKNDVGSNEGYGSGDVVDVRTKRSLGEDHLLLRPAPRSSGVVRLDGSSRRRPIPLPPATRLRTCLHSGSLPLGFVLVLGLREFSFSFRSRTIKPKLTRRSLSSYRSSLSPASLVPLSSCFASSLSPLRPNPHPSPSSNGPSLATVTPAKLEIKGELIVPSPCRERVR